MSSLFESANLALDTHIYRHEIMIAAFAMSTSEIEAKFISPLHANDKMLHHCLNHFENVNFSLSHYLAVATQQYRVVEKIKKALFPNTGQSIKLLDFACGYGRLLRLMSLQVEPKLLWASDINNYALAYVVNSFGVNGIESHAAPERFETSEKFDVIWVASLFSHLPQYLFEAWLERLALFLTPTGVLCFSVHDECLLPSSICLPDSGLYFGAHSEDAELDASIYGTTYVNEFFVANAIKKLFGSTFSYHRMPKGLANEQDLYVIARPEMLDLSPLKNIRFGAWGFVDKIFAEPNGQLYFYGWAASIDDGIIDRIEVKLNGIIHVCHANQRRDDVVEVLQDGRLLYSGWEIFLNMAPAPQSNFVAVTVVSTQGERSLIYLGFVSEGRFWSQKR